MKTYLKNIKIKIDLSNNFNNYLLKLSYIPLLSFSLLLLIVLLIENIISTLIINDQSIRILIVIIFSFLSGFVVGPNLPHGLDKFCKHSTSALALGWTVNGFASVFGGIISILISIFYGFSTTIFVALSFYMMALLICVIFHFFLII